MKDLHFLPPNKLVLNSFFIVMIVGSQKVFSSLNYTYRTELSFSPMRPMFGCATTFNKMNCRCNSYCYRQRSLSLREGRNFIPFFKYACIMHNDLLKTIFIDMICVFNISFTRNVL